MSRSIGIKRAWGKLLKRAGLAAAWLLLAAGVTAEPGVVYYHTDSLGSVVAATDENASVLWRESYRPFGDRIEYEVTSEENTPFYTGKPHDDETELSYFGARDYDPSLGRFTGKDPVGVDPENLHSFNRYAYGNNNPYKYIDPDGNFPFIPIAVWVGKELLAEVVSSQLGVPVSTKGAVKYAAKNFTKSSVRNATKSATYRGGAYGKLDRVKGLERHHMPADSVNAISRHKGPAIQMDKADHALTSSYGSSNAAKAYRSEIANVSPRDAMAREIRDVRRIGGTKYNQATREMLDYAKRSGHLNK